MALSPAEMEAAILRNLAEKTGHDLAGWRDRLAQAGIEDARQRITWLKGQGVGHVSAQVIARRVDDEQPQPVAHDDGVHRAVQGLRDAAGVPSEAVVCAGYIGLRARRQFAVVARRRDGLHYGFALGAVDPDALGAIEGLEPVRGLGGGRITHRIVAPADAAQPPAGVPAALALAVEHGS